MIPSVDFWSDKKVLITGITGFKGSWLARFLNQFGAQLFGIGLPPITSKSIYFDVDIKNIASVEFIDIRDYQKLDEFVSNAQPDVIFHLAAQPLVDEGYRSPHLTFETNILGTLNLLSVIRRLQTLKVLIGVTTDKVYAERNDKMPFTEKDRYSEQDPYSSSKSCVEIILSSFSNSDFLTNTSVVKVRSGNVIGYGDFTEGRLIPDIVKSIESRKELVIANPSHVRPWQHVLEPTYAYCLLAQNYFLSNKKCVAYNIGPSLENHQTVAQVVEIAKEKFGLEKVDINTNVKSFHENNLLYLDSNKVYEDIKFKNSLDFSNSISWALEGYRMASQGVSGVDIIQDQIIKYLKYLS